MRSRFFASSLALVLSMLGVLTTSAVPYTWTGAAGDMDFYNPANWEGGAAPVAKSGTENVLIGKDLVGSTVVNFTSSAALNDIDFSTTNYSFISLISPFETPVQVSLAGNMSVGENTFAYFTYLAPIDLARGIHTFTVEPDGTLVTSGVTGEGSIIKEGAGILSFYLGESANSFSGGLTINGGTVQVESTEGPGSGRIEFNSGKFSNISHEDVTIENDFLFGATPAFDTSSYGGSLRFTGRFDASVSAVSLEILGSSTVYIQGDIYDGVEPTSYTFTGGSTVVLEGSNSYTGGTHVDGTRLIFFGSESLPSAGNLTSSNNAYVGVGSPSILGNFMARLDPASVHGAIGLDSEPGKTPNLFTDDVDLSEFSDSSLYFGSITMAVLNGTLTPPRDASRYNFGGTGMLILQNSSPLTGERSVHAATIGDAGSPFLLVLNGSDATNDYTGVTSADGAGIIFDARGALPEESSVVFTQPLFQPGGSARSPGSYLGITESAGMTAADWVSRIGSHQATSVLGFDSHDLLENLIDPEFEPNPSIHTVSDLDLSSLDGSTYVGTATAAQLTGNITTPNGGVTDYYFAGYGAGRLSVSTLLDGSRSLTVGLPNVRSLDAGGTVTITGANTFSGGTTLLAGELYLESSTDGSPGDVRSGPLGTGALVANPTAASVVLGFGASPSVFANDIQIAAGNLEIETNNSEGLTLSGSISGSGALVFQSSSSLTISNENNNFSGGLTVNGGIVISTADHALGSGGVELQSSGRVVFTSASPEIGGLAGDSAEGSVTLADDATLTVNTSTYGYFNGVISGNEANNARLIKTGTGSLLLSGNNLFTGGTEVRQGTLSAGGNQGLGSGGVSINGGNLETSHGVTVANEISFGESGGTLSGNGTVGSPVTVGALGQLAPGWYSSGYAEIGNLHFASDLTWAAAGAYAFQVQSATGAAGVGYDHVDVTGSLVFSATLETPFTLTLLSIDGNYEAGTVADFDSNSAYSWTIATSTAGLVGFDSSTLSINTSGFLNSINGGSFSFGVSGDNKSLLLNYSPSAVPEPSTWMLIATGVSVVAMTSLRRRKLPVPAETTRPDCRPASPGR